ncbi:reverse transcriptase domain-containing protein [Tanacetum coccineum]|uniref:Reverse transcriptase domain-containing protein n=1 Tax=Tanacetum coccineum TaxID=301880 RepID=A0ABQ5FBF9_9ASTR
MARTPLNENCSAVILNKLPKKLGDPGRFLIPCEFSGINTCNALADLSASINLMPYSVWKNLSLPELTSTCMTLELAGRSISEPIGIAEDVYVTVGNPLHLCTENGGLTSSIIEDNDLITDSIGHKVESVHDYRSDDSTETPLSIALGQMPERLAGNHTIVSSDGFWVIFQIHIDRRGSGG